MIMILMLMKMVTMVMAIGNHKDNGDDVVDDDIEEW